MAEQLTVIDWVPNLLEGLKITLIVTVLGALLMLVLATVLGLMARMHSIIIRGIARTIIEFFRGTSLLIQLYWLYFALPLVGFKMDPILVGVVALGLNFGAYGAEVVRGSLNAVPAAQWEAATALNLTAAQRMRRVIWPQGFALMIPSMNNLLIQLLKSTPLLYTISLVDVMAMGNGFIYAGGSSTIMYLALMVIYFIMAYVMTFISNGTEVYAKSRLGQHQGLRKVFRKRAPDDPLSRESGPRVMQGGDLP